MKYIKATAAIAHLAIMDKWDFLVGIVGQPGSGKSHLNMHLAENYEKYSGQSITAEQINLLADNFISCLIKGKDKKPGYFISIDEGGMLFVRNTMSKFNKAVSQAMMIIRAKGFFMTVCIPYLQALESVVRQRMKILFYVDRRGHCYFWCDERKLRLIDAESRKVGGYLLNIEPDGEDDFPQYEGHIAVDYEQVKLESMNLTLEDLGKLLETEKKQIKLSAWKHPEVVVEELLQENISQTERCKIFQKRTGRSGRYYYKLLHKFSKSTVV